MQKHFWTSHRNWSSRSSLRAGVWGKRGASVAERGEATSGRFMGRAEELSWARARAGDLVLVDRRAVPVCSVAHKVDSGSEKAHALPQREGSSVQLCRPDGARSGKFRSGDVECFETA